MLSWLKKLFTKRNPPKLGDFSTSQYVPQPRPPAPLPAVVRVRKSTAVGCTDFNSVLRPVIRDEIPVPSRVKVRKEEGADRRLVQGEGSELLRDILDYGVDEGLRLYGKPTPTFTPAPRVSEPDTHTTTYRPSEHHCGQDTGSHHSSSSACSSFSSSDSGGCCSSGD